MFAALLPWIVSGAASIGSAFIQNAGNRANQDAMNQYNTPANQMARFKAAGLNPNLVYGQGSSGNQASPVPYEAPRLDIADLYGKHQAYWESRSRMKRNTETSASIMIKRMYDQMKSEEESKYYGSSARYQNSIMKQRLAALIRHGKTQNLQNANLKLDKMIKENVGSERAYYNQLRKYGIEKGDSPLFRMGYSFIKHGMARPAGTSMRGKHAASKP